MNEFLTYLNKVANKVNLNSLESKRAMQIILRGGVNPSQIASYFTALYMKQIDAQEIIGAVKYLNYQNQEMDEDDNSITIANTFSVSKSRVSAELPTALILSAAGFNAIFSGIKLSTSNNLAFILKDLGFDADITLERSIEIYKNIGLSYIPNNLYNSKFIDLLSIQRELPFDILLNYVQPFLIPIRTSNILIYVTEENSMTSLHNSALQLGYKRIGLFFDDGSTEVLLKVFSFENQVDEYRFTKQNKKTNLVEANHNCNFAQDLNDLLIGHQNQYFDYIKEFAISAIIMMKQDIYVVEAEEELHHILNDHRGLSALKNLIANSNQTFKIEA